jgi:hypothetical protein
VLGGVVVLMVVLLAAPIQRFLGSRTDPGYIQQQARTRLQYAMPGDTVYVVVDKGQRSDIERTAGAMSAQAQGPGWNSRLMDSIRAAGK